MRAVVLVGGEGTRLRPLTLTTPKQMLPVAGVPMIERVLAQLVSHGIDDVVLSLGYKPDVFRHAYPDGMCAGAAMEYAVDPEPLDTAGAVKFAAEAVGIDETFVVFNGDVITDIDIAALIAFHRSCGGDATIALTPVDDPSRFGVVPTDDNGRVLAFIEKPPAAEAPTNMINAGIYVLEPSVLAEIPPGRSSIERTTFPSLAAAGRLFAQTSNAPWVDIGTPACYLEANLTIAGHDPVVGAGVRLDDSACVTGSVILDEAVVARDAVVRDSVVGRRAVIGEGAVVEQLTLVGDGAVVAPGTRLSGGRVPEVDV